MKYLYIAGEINDSVVDKFTKDFSLITDNENITVYLSSYGGYSYCAQIIIDILNKHKERITLVASGSIFSAAFNLFFFTECKKELLVETVGMAHFSWIDAEIDGTGKPSDQYTKFLLSEMKKEKNQLLNKYEELGFNKKELSLIKSGKDCYFNNNRLNELLNYG